MASKLPSFVPGEPFDARKVEALRRNVEANGPMRGGPGVRINRKPWGWNASYSGSSSFVPQIWRVQMTGGPKTLQCTIGQGLVNGVEPVIATDKNGDVPISGTADLNPPLLSIPPTAFNKAQNQACLYLQAVMSTDGQWFLQKIYPIAFPSKPPSQPFTAYKLLGFFVIQGGSVGFRQMCYFNLGLGTLFNRTPGGGARYVWYAT